MNEPLGRGDRIAAGAVRTAACSESSTVLGTFETLGGELRYVVQCDTGTLHIYSPEQVHGP